MRTLILSALIAAVTILLPVKTLSHPHIIDVASKLEVSPQSLLDDLRSVQVIFMGELHDNDGHHRAQLAVIDALDDEEQPLAIGLEMFRKDGQESLDLWVNNELPLLKFLPIYEENWSMWPKYREIFLHARTHTLRMIGLNISRSITSKVASSGFKSLSEEQKNLLGNVQCQVNPFYSNFIRQAMGEHAGHGEQFLFFCEAQLLWDTMMARNLVDFLQQNPGYRMVVMAGSGHAWKFGIPRQMLAEADISYRVLLPEVANRVDRRNVNKEITDYLWLDEGEDGWTF